MVTDFSIFNMNCGHFSKKSASRSRLSPREAEILTWTAEGKTCFEISLLLNIAEETVRSHVKNACQRLNAVNKVQAVAIAMTLSLIVPFVSARFSMAGSIPRSGDSKTYVPASKSKRVLCIPMRAESGW